MRFSLCLVLFTAILASASSTSCEAEPKDCSEETEYGAYVECVKVRSKRSANCNNNSCENGDCNNNNNDSDDCEDCDCDSCSYNRCQNSCNSCCSNCCNVITSCSNNNCCHKTCHANCKTNSCRTSCKKSCKQSVISGSSKTSSSSTDSKTAIDNRSAHNITTVIHLNNIINNTNLINVPVNVNSTNFHNITIDNEGSSFSGGSSGGGGGDVVVDRGTSNNCCHIVGPRQCVPQDKFPFVRCFHVRKRACGYMCTSPIIHYQKHEICDQDVPQQPCHQQAVYIPQPRPRCAHYPVWPYVSCGGGAQESCDGCYSHYTEKSVQQSKCSPYCYDDGFGPGPYYRQGPYYRPGYAHVPSCIQTGSCGTEGGFYNGLGYGYGEGYGFGPIGGVPLGLPQGGVGYPVSTYGDGPFIEDNGSSWTNNGTQYSFTTFEETNLNADSNFQNISKEPTIEALYQPPRSPRFAEITIQSEDEEQDKENKSAEPQAEQVEEGKEKMDELTTENLLPI